MADPIMVTTTYLAPTDTEGARIRVLAGALAQESAVNYHDNDIHGATVQRMFPGRYVEFVQNTPRGSQFRVHPQEVDPSVAALMAHAKSEARAFGFDWDAPKETS